METIIKSLHFLAELLPESELEKLTAGALQHRKFSRITFKVLSVASDSIKVQTVQDKTPHENYADEVTLIDRTKELFEKFFPDRRIVVNVVRV